VKYFSITVYGNFIRDEQYFHYSEISSDWCLLHTDYTVWTQDTVADSLVRKTGNRSSAKINALVINGGLRPSGL
jgi:beta-galactosidase/beta-glucuronidase